MLYSQVLNNSFYLTYVFLITTGTITFIEALRTANPTIRHIMNLETCISIVAAFFYSLFVQKIKDSSTIDYIEVNTIRYTDWFITTPLMLMVLCSVLGHEKNMKLYISTYLIILLLDIGMIGTGYLGETKVLDKPIAFTLSFACYFLLFAFIYYKFMYHGKNTFICIFLFYSFLILWSIYGLVYFMDEKIKNTIFNILDLIAKAIVGLVLWLYFTGIIDFTK